ncbi:MAG: NAD(P)/FAD-dependent oxidoreductase [Chitinophagaceae bacterium]|nr:MAG: NAD(P)/FAD-dependent oxidoreductase [Chitinophagaceae bacterium]
MQTNETADVIVIGGSYAGLSAALGLGRSLRKTLVIDNGLPCNRTAPHSHNFLTQDGVEPSVITAIGKAQVAKYPTVSFVDDTAVSIGGSDNNFLVETSTGGSFSARKIMLATGILDQLPAIKGFRECWGKSVIHCPFCHGYEYHSRPTGLLMNGDHAMEMGNMISNWSGDITIYTNGPCSFTPSQLEILQQKKIRVNVNRISQLVHLDGQLQEIQFENGDKDSPEVLYHRPLFEQKAPSLASLGCELDTAGYIRTDEFQRTTVPGIYAAGDNSSGFRAVSMAVANGSKTAGMLVRELLQ